MVQALKMRDKKEKNALLVGLEPPGSHSCRDSNIRADFHGQKYTDDHYCTHRVLTTATGPTPRCPRRLRGQSSSTRAVFLAFIALAFLIWPSNAHNCAQQLPDAQKSFILNTPDAHTVQYTLKDDGTPLIIAVPDLFIKDSQTDDVIGPCTMPGLTKSYSLVQETSEPGHRLTEDYGGHIELHDAFNRSEISLTVPLSEMARIPEGSTFSFELLVEPQTQGPVLTYRWSYEKSVSTGLSTKEARRRLPDYLDGMDLAELEGLDGMDLAELEGLDGLDLAELEGLDGLDLAEPEGLNDCSLAIVTPGSFIDRLTLDYWFDTEGLEFQPTQVAEWASSPELGTANVADCLPIQASWFFYNKSIDGPLTPIEDSSTPFTLTASQDGSSGQLVYSHTSGQSTQTVYEVSVELVVPGSDYGYSEVVFNFTVSPSCTPYLPNLFYSHTYTAPTVTEPWTVGLVSAACATSSPITSYSCNQYFPTAPDYDVCQHFSSADGRITLPSLDSDTLWEITYELDMRATNSIGTSVYTVLIEVKMADISCQSSLPTYNTDLYQQFPPQMIGDSWTLLSRGSESDLVHGHDPSVCGELDIQFTYKRATDATSTPLTGSSSVFTAHRRTLTDWGYYFSKTFYIMKTMTNDPAEAGLYTLSYTASLVNYDSVVISGQPSSFNVEVIYCGLSTSASGCPVSPVTHIYGQITTIAPWDLSTRHSSCDTLGLTCLLSAGPTNDIDICATQSNTVAYFDDALGSYKVLQTMADESQLKLGTYTIRLAATTQIQDYECTFDFVITEDACNSATLSFVSQGFNYGPTDLYQLASSDPVLIAQWQEAEIVSSDVTNCGSFRATPYYKMSWATGFSEVTSENMPFLRTFDDWTMEDRLQVFSDSPLDSYIGQHQLKIEVGYANYPSVAPVSYKWTFEIKAATLPNCSSQPYVQYCPSYQDFQFSTPYRSPAWSCGGDSVTFTCEQLGAPSQSSFNFCTSQTEGIAQFNANYDGTLSVESTRPQDIYQGTYQIKLTAAWYISPEVIVGQCEFLIEVINPCMYAGIGISDSSDQIVDQTYQFTDPLTVISPQPSTSGLTYTVSPQFHDFNHDLCGEIKLGYEVSLPSNSAFTSYFATSSSEVFEVDEASDLWKKPEPAPPNSQYSGPVSYLITYGGYFKDFRTVPLNPPYTFKWIVKHGCKSTVTIDGVLPGQQSIFPSQLSTEQGVETRLHISAPKFEVSNTYCTVEPYTFLEFPTDSPYFRTSQINTAGHNILQKTPLDGLDPDLRGKASFDQEIKLSYDIRDPINSQVRYIAYTWKVTVRVLNPCTDLDQLLFVADQSFIASYDYTVGSGPINLSMPRIQFPTSADGLLDPVALCGLTKVLLGDSVDRTLIDETDLDQASGLASFQAEGLLDATGGQRRDRRLIRELSGPAKPAVVQGPFIKSVSVEFKTIFAEYEFAADTYFLAQTATVNLYDCGVDTSDFIVPAYDAQVYDTRPGQPYSDQSPLEIEFQPVESPSGLNCGFELTYAFLDSNGSDVDFVQQSTDGTLLSITMPKDLQDGETSLQVTQLATLQTNTGPYTKEVPLDLNFIKGAADGVIILTNQAPFFANELKPVYTFDIAGGRQFVDLGQIVDLEGDAFVISDLISRSEALNMRQTDAVSLLIEFDPSPGLTLTGDYELSLKLTELIGVTSRDTKLTVGIKVIDTTSPEEVIEVDTPGNSTNTDSPVVSPETATEKETPAEVTVVWNAPYVPKPKFELPSEVKALNKGIMKPTIPRVEADGSLKILYSADRIDESGLTDYAPDTQARMLSTNETAVSEPDDPEFVKIVVYGEPEEGSDASGSITMYIEVGDMSLQQELIFTYQIEKFGTKDIQTQLFFKNPEVISSNTEKEYIVIELRDLRDAEGLLIAEDMDLRVELPNQMTEGQAIAIAIAGTAAASTVQSSVILNLILNFFMRASVNKMLGAVKNLQVIVHLCLMWKLIVPAIAEGFFMAIFDMIKFDMVDLSDFGINTMDIVQLTPSEDEEEPGQEDEAKATQDQIYQDPFEYFVGLGYESQYFLSNLGSLLYVVVIQMVYLPILFIVWVLSSRNFTRARSCSGSRLSGCFCNGLLTFIDGTFVVIMISAMVNIYLALKGQVSIELNFYCSVGTLVVCFVQFLGIIYFLKSRYKHLDEEKNTRRCGYIYEEYNPKLQGKWALSYPLVFQLRFALLVYALLFQMQTLVFQMAIVTLSTVAVLAILGNVHPYKELGRNYSNLASEFVIILILDMLFAASDPKMPPKTRTILGWMIVCTLSLSILLSQGSLIWASIKAIIRKRQLKKILKNNLKRHEEAKKRRALVKANKVQQMNEGQKAPMEGRRRRRKALPKLTGQITTIQERPDENESDQEQQKLRIEGQSDRSSNVWSLKGQKSGPIRQKMVVGNQMTVLPNESQLLDVSQNELLESPNKAYRDSAFEGDQIMLDLPAMRVYTKSRTDAAQVAPGNNYTQAIGDQTLIEPQPRQSLQPVKKTCLSCEMRGSTCILCQLDQEENEGDRAIEDMQARDGGERSPLVPPFLDYSSEGCGGSPTGQGVKKSDLFKDAQAKVEGI